MQLVGWLAARREQLGMVISSLLEHSYLPERYGVLHRTIRRATQLMQLIWAPVYGGPCTSSIKRTTNKTEAFVWSYAKVLHRGA